MNLLEIVRKQKLLSFTLLLFTLSIGILIGTLMNTGVRAARAQVAPDATPLTIPDPVQLSTAFSQLAKKLEPSVVNITSDYFARQSAARGSRRQAAPQDQGDQGSMDDFFRRFFGTPYGGDNGQSQRRAGTGSGVIVDANGYILTNNHVVDGADRLTVKLDGDQTIYTAKLVGTDVETDLAVIKIDVSRKLPAAKIGNSDAVQVGDWAVAIGSPFGLDASVTAGIISAKGRDIGANASFQHFLQTDAAINPGNSGGPLLNINGEVIGINTAIATTSNSSSGVGFALPINTAVNVYNKIIKSGRVTRGSIGVSLSTNPDNALMKVYGATEGAFVSSVKSDGPAAKAGVKEGDVLVSLNGKALKTGDDLVNAVAEAEVGSQARLGLVRDGKRLELPISIADRSQVYPEIAGSTSVEPAAETAGGQGRLGIWASDIPQNDRASLNLPEKGGVRVTRVDAGSFAEDIGVAPNDVLTAINRQPVNSAEDMQRILGALKPGDAVAFRVLSRQGSRGSGTSQWTSRYPAGTMPRNQ
jgi:serine protease Do